MSNSQNRFSYFCWHVKIFEVPEVCIQPFCFLNVFVAPNKHVSAFFFFFWFSDSNLGQKKIFAKHFALFFVLFVALGLDVKLFSAIGKDEFGAFLQRKLSEEEMNLDTVMSLDCATCACIVLSGTISQPLERVKYKIKAPKRFCGIYSTWTHGSTSAALSRRQTCCSLIFRILSHLVSQLDSRFSQRPNSTKTKLREDFGRPVWHRTNTSSALLCIRLDRWKRLDVFVFWFFKTLRMNHTLLRLLVLHIAWRSFVYGTASSSSKFIMPLSWEALLRVLNPSHIFAQLLEALHFARLGNSWTTSKSGRLDRCRMCDHVAMMIFRTMVPLSIDCSNVPVCL